MLKQQKPEYINQNINKVFHFLELQGYHNYLIGSNSIRNILYSNDYDLNTDVNVVDTIPILKFLHKEFLHMFEEAYKNPNYYIIDFKCGYIKDEPLRWSFQDLKKGFKNNISFEEALFMSNNKIKLDMCFLNNNIFTDINCLYNLHIVQKQNHYKQSKKAYKSNAIKTLNDEISDLERDGEYYKAMKRHFNVGLLQGKLNKTILNIMNGDLGIYHKFISFLKLVVEVITQDFKPVELSLIKSNLEYIKQFASSITTVNIEPHLNKLVHIIELNNKSTIVKNLNTLINNCTDELNKLINKVM